MRINEQLLKSWGSKKTLGRHPSLTSRSAVLKGGSITTIYSEVSSGLVSYPFLFLSCFLCLESNIFYLASRIFLSHISHFLSHISRSLSHTSHFLFHISHFLSRHISFPFHASRIFYLASIYHVAFLSRSLKC